MNINIKPLDKNKNQKQKRKRIRYQKCPTIKRIGKIITSERSLYKL